MLNHRSRGARRPAALGTILLALLFTAACQSSPAGSPTEQYQNGILIEQLGDDVSGSALPVVRFSINGRDGRFLLDTGASHSALSPDFAAALGMPAIGNITGNDSGGAIVHGSVLPPVEISGAGLEVPARLAQPIVLDIGPLTAIGLDGVISPQSLAGKGCVLLDFPSARLLINSADPQACALDAFDYSSKSLTGTIRRPVIAVAIGTRNAGPIPFLVDTGAQMTSITQGPAQGLPQLGTQQSQGVSGVQRARMLAGPVSLFIGQSEARLDKVAVEKADKELSKLGMDALGTARIVLTAQNTVILKF